MKIILERAKDNIGQLSIDDMPFCLILENPTLKIPAGTYQLGLLYSQHFQRYNLHLLNVPTRQGIEIHTGNFYENSEGCLITGTDEMPAITNPRNGNEPWVDGSTQAYEALMQRVSKYIFADFMARYDVLEITIVDFVEN